MKTLVSIKLDSDVKENAQKLAKEIGLPLSSIINAYLKHVIRTKELVFSSVPQATPTLDTLLSEVEKDLASQTNLSKPFHTPQEAHNHLDTL
ncbi:MAG: DUF6364 family protein [bacterium]|nr:DUF6364 family protein [bacterium]